MIGIGRRNGCDNSHGNWRKRLWDEKEIFLKGSVG